MTTIIRTLMLLGFTGLVAGASGCIIETTSNNGNGSQTCLQNQYFVVDWGADHGPGTIPLTCSEMSSRGLSVLLHTTGAGAYSTLTPEFYVSCNDGRLCQGLPCPAEGSTGSQVPVGTEVVTADVVDGTGVVINTADAVPGFPIVACNPTIVSYVFNVP